MSNQFHNTLQFAKSKDLADPLHHFRHRFHFPKTAEGNHSIYFCGNSLGLLPRTVHRALEIELEDWQNLSVQGHGKARTPWFSYHEVLSLSLASLVGAKTTEVVAMGSLTANLHSLLATFYRPNTTRKQILILGQEFPSDRYAIESHVQWHGLKREEVIVEMIPEAGELLINPDRLIEKIRQLGESLSLVHMSAVHYYSGQLFDVSAITKAAHEVGALVGFDLAHTIGNVPLQLHDWNVDYAVWCSYKYLNSGPGGVGGIFVHERHSSNPETLRLAGWWGNDPESRFTMPQWFTPKLTAESWQTSNAPIFPMAIHRASLEIFDEAGMDALRLKSIELTNYAEFVLRTLAHDLPDEFLTILTPSDSSQRGAQLSITSRNIRRLYDFLTENGVVVDWRQPNVIRIAPAPLYCSFEDVWCFGQILSEAMACVIQH